MTVSLLVYYGDIFDAIDSNDDNRLSLRDIVLFARLFYRSSPSSDYYQGRVFYRKLRFYFYFYLDKSQIKLDDVEEGQLKVDPELVEEKKLFYDRHYDIHVIGKGDFFNICIDMNLFTQADLYKGRLGVTRKTSSA